MLQAKNFAYLNFDDSQLLEKWNEELVMSALDDVYPDYDFMRLMKSRIFPTGFMDQQTLPSWQNLIITGSNAKMLRAARWRLS